MRLSLEQAGRVAHSVRLADAGDASAEDFLCEDFNQVIKRAGDGDLKKFLDVLKDAIKVQFPNQYPSLETVEADKIVVGVEGQNYEMQYFEMGYEVDRNGNFSFKTPQKREKNVSFESTSKPLTVKELMEDPMWIAKMQRLADIGSDPGVEPKPLTENEVRQQILAGVRDADPRLVKHLVEKKGQGTMLLEEIRPNGLTLLEEEQLQEGKVVKPMKVGGVASKGNVFNENGRYYATTLWENQCEKKRALVEQGKFLGELDHPDDGRSRLSRTALKFTDLYMDGDLFSFKAEVLETSAGKDLKGLLRGNVGVDISTRGFGSTAKQKIGTQEGDVVQDDFELVAIDAVAGGSVSQARISWFK